MTEYTYTAILPDGKKVKGTFQASKKNEVLEYMHQRNMTPVSIKVVATKEKRDITITNPFKKQTYNLKDIVFFTRQLATMLNAGLNVTAAIATLSKQASNKGLEETLKEVYTDTTLGISLSESLKRHPGQFPPFLFHMIEVGEISGNLDSIMLKMADFYEREYAINKKVRNALTYPAIVLLVTLIMMTFILVFVLPSFESMFTDTGAELPTITKVLIAMSASMVSHWYLYFLGVLTIVLGIRGFLRTDKGQETLSVLKMRLPLIRKQYRMIITSRFARTMQILLYSGITITYALEITSNVMGNTVMKEKVLEIRNQVNEGDSFSSALEQTAVFPDILLSMVSIGEASGSLDEMLHKASSYYDSEMERAIDQLIKMIEPASILLVAVLVAFALFAILMPMLDMINLF